MTERDLQERHLQKRYSQKSQLNFFRFVISAIVFSALFVPTLVISATTASSSAKSTSSATVDSTAKESSSFNITITADSVGISVSAGAPSVSSEVVEREMILIPKSSVSVSTSQPDTVFESSKYENGTLTAEDSLGREWEYDSRLGVFRLRWEDVRSTGSGREGMVFYNAEDTVFVSRDRDPDWALDIKRKLRTRARSVHVRAEEYVPRAITTSKKVRVDGLVDGDVISSKEVIVGSTGVINGDVSAPSIRVSDGGLITGDENEVSDNLEITRDFGDDYRRVIDFGAIPIFVGLATLLILVAFVSLSVAPDSVARASQAINNYTWTTIRVGLLSIFAWPFLIALLVGSIVAIPLAIIAVLATPVALLVGIVAYSQFSGQTALAAYGVDGATLLRKIVVGILILIGLWTVAFALQSSRTDFLAGIGVVLLITAIIFSAVAVFAGIGGVVLTRFGRREYTPKPKRERAGFPPPPSPPPKPQPPPMPYV